MYFYAWTGGPWTHFFAGCLEACRILSSALALDWILHFSTTVTPGFALFTAATPFADAACYLLDFLTIYGNVSPAGMGDQLPSETLASDLPGTPFG